MNLYASSPSGGGQPLSLQVQASLAQQLSNISHAFSALAYAEAMAVGVVNCFQGFSTFRCRPLLNIHDLIVHPDYRGQGISQLLLAHVEQEAIARGCCKLTLEVLQGNTAARGAYTKFGFQAYELDPAMGQAIFLEKRLGVDSANHAD